MTGSPFEVAVTGIGMLTPAGIGTEATWARVMAGTPTAAPDPALAGLPVDFTCRVPDFRPADLFGPRRVWRLDRHVQLAMAAAREAVADAGLDPAGWDGARVGVVMGNGLGGTATYEKQHQILLERGVAQVSPMFIPMFGVNMVAGQIAIDLGATGPNLVTATACASGTTALGTARDLLRSGVCDIVLAGGAEACLSRAVIAGLTNTGALSRCADPAGASRPFDTDRDGFVAGEGAAVLVLERPADVRARGGRIRARITGYGASADGHHETAPHPDGAGIRLAITAALADAGVAPGDVDHVNAHGSSTQLNDLVESRVLGDVLGPRPAITSTKGVIGHCIGAAGAIEAACTVLAVEHGTVPPTANLDHLDPRIEADVVVGTARHTPLRVAISNSFGFGGQNGVLVITAH
ncbi:MAG: beta-ketoacyl-[acyl-carrier-protein] synthase family protein [Pseudonocardiaceae bacterium]